MEPSILQLAITFFFIANPIGQTPAIITLVKDFPLERQYKIVAREGFIALLIILFFQYIGEAFLELIHVQSYSLSICGGALLLLVALSMIFPERESTQVQSLKQEPIVVPIATPFISGPGLITAVMVYSSKFNDHLLISSSILLCFVIVFAVLFLAPFLNRYLGKGGLRVLEQIMGMVVSMISMQMIVQGVIRFIEASH